MASRRKGSSRRKSPVVPDPIAPPPAPSGSPTEGKYFGRILIAAVLIIVAYEAVKRFNSAPVHKDFKVQTLLQFTGSKTKSGRFNSCGIASIGKDKVMVVDQEHDRMVVFDRKGKFLLGWGKKGTKPMEFNEPTGATSDDKGNAYVIDTWNGAIKGFDERGKEVLDRGLTSGFYGPRGLFFDGTNFLVVDSGSHRVVTISPDGTVLAAWGGLGDGKGKFRGPMAVATDRNGHYFVADTDNHRIQVLDKDGNGVKFIKYEGAVWSVAVDKEGRFYVPNTDEGGCIKVYSSVGDYIGTLVDQAGVKIGPYRALSVSPDDVLMGVDGDSAALYQLPGQLPGNP